MKRFAIVGGICASFLLGTGLAASAQDEHKDERPNAAPQERQEPTRPQDQARPADRQNQDRPNENRQNQDRPSEDRRNQEPQAGDRHDKTPQSEGRQPQEPQSGDRHMQGKPGNEEHGQGQQRRIPDKDFHAHFGQPHRFAVGHLQTYQGRPSFAYSGYTFVLVEPWPAGWVYDDDDCYIDYIDGDYWLFNVLYPGVRVELFIVE